MEQKKDNKKDKQKGNSKNNKNQEDQNAQKEKQRKEIEELRELTDEGALDEEGILEEELASQQEEEEIDKDTLSSLEGKSVFRVKIVHSSATVFCISTPELKVDKGDYVIVPTKYGRDLGKIQGVIENLLQIGTDPVLTIQRKATDSDSKLFEEFKEKDKKAFEICSQKIIEHKLNMKLVSAHYLLDEPKILFFFTAEARVDFRGLVKDLVSIFKTRIELRQIGVRDESRVIGGIGICGRCYCCNSITDKLKPVSIKMAKEQNLSLNSLKISGACGRLLCCLSYEYPFYKDLKKCLPFVGEKITYKDDLYIVDDINIFRKCIILKDKEQNIYKVSFDKLERNEKKNNWKIKSLT